MASHAGRVLGKPGTGFPNRGRGGEAPRKTRGTGRGGQAPRKNAHRMWEPSAARGAEPPTNAQHHTRLIGGAGAKRPARTRTGCGSQAQRRGRAAAHKCAASHMIGLRWHSMLEGAGTSACICEYNSGKRPTPAPLHISTRTGFQRHPTASREEHRESAHHSTHHAASSISTGHPNRW